MMAVESTRNKYREGIERLEQVHGILKQALELDLVEPGDTRKPN
jgi:hypothetical protein